MTAFSAIYSSLTGLLSYTTALDVVSQNISNLNTPGFKSNESLFEDLGPLQVGNEAVGGSFEDAIGQGVTVDGQVTNFSEGQIQSTGNPTDLAINGNGFFVVQVGSQLVYTRNGQFTFNGGGQLVNATGDPVMAIGANGNLSDLIVNQTQQYPATPSTTVKFDSTLSTGQSGPYTVSSIDVVDASGTSQTLSAAFTLGTNSSTGSIEWTVNVTNSSGVTVGTGTIQFSGAGTPQAGSDTITVTLPTANNTSSQITFDFSDATSNSSGATSSLAVESVDGTPSGSLTGVTFDQNGVAQLAFSNGQTLTGSQLALASFPNPGLLVEDGTSGYIVPPGSTLTPTLGHAGEGGYGTIEAGNLELANVDLGNEFAEIIVLQQGYDGSSQVLNVSSQLLDTLYKALGQS